jgi:predicted amidohydrolase
MPGYYLPTKRHFKQKGRYSMRRDSSVALIAIQMRTTLEDYQHESYLARRVDRLLAAARQQVQAGLPALVVLPEDIGLGMLFFDDYEAVRGCKSIFEAAGVLLQRYASSIQQKVEKLRVSPTRALLLVLGERLEPRYRRLFSQAARKHKVTLVAGTAPLPDRQRSPAVYNTCYVFNPNGQLILTQRKVHLIPLEQDSGMDLCPATVDEVQVVDTPAGRLGVAICLDAFHTDVVEALARQKARLIAQPSFNPLAWTPEQAESWKTGLWQACQRYPDVIGINPMMVGKLFDDVVMEGRSSIVAHASRTHDGSGYLAQASNAVHEEIVAVEINP